MNRVICCYPFVERLMSAALSSSRRFVAATFPRERIGARIAMSAGNLYCRIRGVDFRSYLHPHERIMSTAKAAGFEVVFRDRDFIWTAVVFERAV